MKRLDFDIPLGEAFGPLSYELTAETVARYVAAVEDDHPWYREGSPFGGPIAPPAMAALYNVGVLRQAFQVPAGSIHARQIFDFLRPARPGMRILTPGDCLKTTHGAGSRV